MAENLDLGKVVGSQIMNVSAAPASAAGLVGDWAMNTANGDVYEKTDEATWTKRGNFKGPKGDKGDQGAKGDAGAAGVQGPKGDKGDTGPQGPAGASGANGADGKTPTLSIDAAGHLIATYDA